MVLPPTGVPVAPGRFRYVSQGVLFVDEPANCVALVAGSALLVLLVIRLGRLHRLVDALAGSVE